MLPSHGATIRHMSVTTGDLLLRVEEVIFEFPKFNGATGQVVYLITEIQNSH